MPAEENERAQHAPPLRPPFRAREAPPREDNARANPRPERIDNIPRVLFNEDHEPQQLQIAPQRPPVLHAFVDGIPLRFIDNVFAADKQDFVRFCARNPHLANDLIVLTYFPQPVNELLFQIRL